MSIRFNCSPMDLWTRMRRFERQLEKHMEDCPECQDEDVREMCEEAKDILEHFNAARHQLGVN